jgi:hypothetical protein
MLLLENSWCLLNLYIEVEKYRSGNTIWGSIFSIFMTRNWKNIGPERFSSVHTRSFWRLKKRPGHIFVVYDMLGEGNIYQRNFCLSIVTFSEVQV